jgi:hypothetical protein
LRNPLSALEEFAPITTGDSWAQRVVPELWGDLNARTNGISLADSCLNCRAPRSITGWRSNTTYPDCLRDGLHRRSLFQTVILDTVPTGGFSLTGNTAGATSGTVATIANKRSRTLTHDSTDSVSVQDFVRHTTIVLHAGQSYLAEASKHK